jgi:hypothetical protein
MEQLLRNQLADGVITPEVFTEAWDSWVGHTLEDRHLAERNQAWDESLDPPKEVVDISIANALGGVSMEFLNTLIDFSPNLALPALAEKKSSTTSSS